MALRDIFDKTGVTAVDCTVIALVIVIAVGLAIYTLGMGGRTPAQCVIEIDGEEFARYDLVSIAEDKIIEIDNEYGRNTIVITSRGAQVTYSDCADALEVRAGVITESGQSLICLPHRLVVRLESAHMPDGVAW